MKCDKLSCEPAKHYGPFEFIETYQDEDGGEVSAEHCGSCGNVVLRDRPKEKDQ